MIITIITSFLLVFCLSSSRFCINMYFLQCLPVIYLWLCCVAPQCNYLHVPCAVSVIGLTAVDSALQLLTQHINNKELNWIELLLYSPLLSLGRVFSFLFLYAVGRTPCSGDQPVTRPALTHRTTQTQNKPTQYRYSCLKRDSNSRSQRSSERRHFMP
jgi:hypothetical protein